MKNAFYFTINIFSFSRYSHFVLDFLVIKKNSLIRNIKLISKFMASQPGKQAISMKFGDLIECNTKKTSLEKSHRK